MKVENTAEIEGCWWNHQKAVHHQLTSHLIQSLQRWDQMNIHPLRKPSQSSNPICWRAHYNISRTRGNLFIWGGNLRTSQDKWKNCEKASAFQGLCYVTMNTSYILTFDETVGPLYFKDHLSDSVHTSYKLKLEETLWHLHEVFVFVILHSVVHFVIRVHDLSCLFSFFSFC